MSLGFGLGLEYSKLSGGGFEGLLNKFPGVSLGLSLDKLDKNYTGSAIKVRRSSDNAEKNIGFVNNVLDASSLMTFAGSDTVTVTIWYDQSGSGNNATQTQGSRQPMIVDAGTLIRIEGQAAIQGDGIDDMMVIGTSINLYTLASQWSVFLVSKIKDFDGQEFQKIITNTTEEATEAVPFLIQARNNNDLIFVANGGSEILELTNITNESLITNIKTSSNTFNQSGSVSETGSFGTLDQTTNQEPLYIMGDGTPNRVAKVALKEVLIWELNQSANKTPIQASINERYNL
jgi:hypothetical protein